MEPVFDAAIIGGGINGCGCAADAALRGLSVALCEKSDIGSQTSSKSTKLIHGGLRYLEQYDFKLVKKALTERQTLLDLAPHLVRPLKLVLPYETFMRPGWFIRTGLFIYDNLSRKNKLPKSRSINRNTHETYFKPLKNKFNKGFVFYDGATNDSRLTLINAIAAKEQGAKIYTHTELIDAFCKDNIWHLTLQNKHNNSVFKLKARTVINAAGPWSESINKLLNIPQDIDMTLVKGSHIVVPALYKENHAYFLQGKDKRVIFVIPYFGYSMIGTTDVLLSEPLKEISISETEIHYLCAFVNQYFNTAIYKESIVNTWSGVRPLVKRADETLHEISRDYHFHMQKKPAPVITIYGGKITTYRKLAAEVIDQLRFTFQTLPSSQTASHALPGAELNGLSFENYKIHAQKQYAWLDKSILERYLTTYGTRTEQFLKPCHSKNDLGIHFGHGLYQKEIDYLIYHEWATNCEDILWRRTKLGLTFEENKLPCLKEYINTMTIPKK